jgi:ABC-type nitrate/sulfonate/bicarbonate transport system substrate-binding protein
VKVRSAGWLTLIGAAVAGIVAGFLVTGGSSPTGATTALTKVTYAYDWIGPDMEIIPVLAAQKEGFFKAEGLNVSIVFPPTTASTSQFLALNKAQIGFITTADMADAVANKVPLLSIANFSMSNNWGLFTKPGVMTPLSDLKGKTVFSYGDNWTNAMLPFVVKHEGLTMSQIKVVSGTNDVAELLAGKINFSTNTTNYEIPYIKAASKTHDGPGEVLTGSAIGVPNIPIWNYATTTGYSIHHATVLKEFLAAVLSGTKWAIKNPVAAAKLLDKTYPTNGETFSTNYQAWSLTIPLLHNAKGAFFTETSAQWSILDAALKATKQISKIPSPDSYFTNAYQP